MIISCPCCEKKFQVPDDQVADKKAVRLRCSSCQHLWIHQFNHQNELASSARPDGDPKECTTLDSHSFEEPLKVAQPGPTPVAYKVSSTQKRLVWSLYLAISLLIMMPILVLMRYHIVHAIPQAEVAYEALGLEVNTRNEFFSFHDVTFRKLGTDAGDKLVIRGKIKYQPPEQEARMVPRVRVTVYGKADCGKQAWWDKKNFGANHFLERGLCVLDSWTFSTKDNLALPGEVIPFEKEKLYASEAIMPSEINLQFERQS